MQSPEGELQVVDDGETHERSTAPERPVGRVRLTYRPLRRAAVMRLAAGIAAISAAALLRHSRSSSSGTESATMPAPACRLAMRVPSAARAARTSCGSRSPCRGCPTSRRSRRRPAYGPALDRFELVDDLHRPHLRRAADRARRQRRPQHVDRAELVAQVARHLRREVHHVAVALERHQLVGMHRAELGDPPDVVAGEVDEHHVLGPLLGVLDQLRRQPPVVLVGAARACGCRRSAAR